ncbi:MAG: hypothetical protein AB7P03_23820 [Kofleriaceae bacterium]
MTLAAIGCGVGLVLAFSAATIGLFAPFAVYLSLCGMLAIAALSLIALPLGALALIVHAVVAVRRAWIDARAPLVIAHDTPLPMRDASEHAIDLPAEHAIELPAAIALFSPTRR